MINNSNLQSKLNYRIKVTEFISLCLSILGIMFALVDYNNWAGWVIFSLSFIIILLEKEIRDSRIIYLECIAILLIYHSVALINANFFSLFGANQDALVFHNWASHVAETHEYYSGLGFYFYVNFLGFFYMLDQSMFFGQEFNVLACAVFLIYLFKLMRLLKITDYHSIILLPFILLPNYFLFLPALLREAFELLFFIMIVYYGLKYRLQGTRWSDCFLCLFCCGLWILWHRAFYLYVPFLLGMFFLWPFPRKKISLKVFLTIGVLLLVIIILAKNFYGNVAGLEHINLAALSYAQNEAKSAGSAYQYAYDYSSIPAAIKSLSICLGYYLFSPMIWQVRSFGEALVSFYVIIRIVLLIMIMAKLFRLDRFERSVWLWFLAVYFSFSQF